MNVFLTASTCRALSPCVPFWSRLFLRTVISARCPGSSFVSTPMHRRRMHPFSRSAGGLRNGTKPTRPWRSRPAARRANAWSSLTGQSTSRSSPEAIRRASSFARRPRIGCDRAFDRPQVDARSDGRILSEACAIWLWAPSVRPPCSSRAPHRRRRAVSVPGRPSARRPCPRGASAASSVRARGPSPATSCA